MNLSKRAVIVKSALESNQRVLTQTIARYGEPNDHKSKWILEAMKSDLAEINVMLQEIMVNGTLMYIKEKRE